MPYDVSTPDIPWTRCVCAKAWRLVNCNCWSRFHAALGACTARPQIVRLLQAFQDMQRMTTRTVFNLKV
eukprot:3707777-Amphidinium_carterae.1